MPFFWQHFCECTQHLPNEIVVSTKMRHPDLVPLLGGLNSSILELFPKKLSVVDTMSFTFSFQFFNNCYVGYHQGRYSWALWAPKKDLQQVSCIQFMNVIRPMQDKLNNRNKCLIYNSRISYNLYGITQQHNRCGISLLGTLNF